MIGHMSSRQQSIGRYRLGTLLYRCLLLEYGAHGLVHVVHRRQWRHAESRVHDKVAVVVRRQPFPRKLAGVGRVVVDTSADEHRVARLDADKESVGVDDVDRQFPVDVKAVRWRRTTIVGVCSEADIIIPGTGRLAAATAAAGDFRHGSLQE